MTVKTGFPFATQTATYLGKEPCGIRRRDTATGLLAGAILAIAGGGGSAQAQPVKLAVVDVTIVSQGYRARKLLGTAVQNDANQKIGSLEDLIITKDHGLFGIIQVGAFLGLGGHLVAIPYDSLAISDDGRKITLAGASKEALHNLPEYHEAK